MGSVGITGTGIARVGSENRCASRSRTGGRGVGSVGVDRAETSRDGVGVRRFSTTRRELGGLPKADRVVADG